MHPSYIRPPTHDNDNDSPKAHPMKAWRSWCTTLLMVIDWAATHSHSHLLCPRTHIISISRPITTPITTSILILILTLSPNQTTSKQPGSLHSQDFISLPSYLALTLPNRRCPVIYRACRTQITCRYF
ncbi:hypothetical protein HD806DRAFT_199934 [Xylariaceae sp. AK1471]|nr:hypothetical protein HD806DRAFT_199934 [Xylariaceae sp. AK1471]